MFPIIFQSSVFTIYSLWFFTLIGFVLGAMILYHLIKTSRLSLNFVTDNWNKLLLSTILTSRIFTVIAEWQFYLQPHFSGESWWIIKRFWNIVAIWDKGLSFWGAALGLVICFAYLAYKQEQNLAKWADILIISIVGGISMGNIGAYMDGINYGKPTKLPWGVLYESSSVKYAIPVHPTQIYAFLYCVAIVAILYTLYRAYRNQYDGLVAYYGIFLYSVFRVIENLFRGDDVLMISIFRLSTLTFSATAIGSGILVYTYCKAHRINLWKTIWPSFGSASSKNESS